MLVYRITSSKYAHDISGIGAAFYGGRWNPKGIPVLYTGESKEIALLETIVHIPPLFIPKLDMLTIEIPNSILEFKHEHLPKNWNKYPAPSNLAEIGKKWALEAQHLALKVPSCIIQTAYNYILNCNHPDYNKKVKIVDQKRFHLDERLIKK